MSRGEAKDSALLSSRHRCLLEPTEWPKGNQASPGAPRPGCRCTLRLNQLLAHLDPGQEGHSPELGQLTVSSRQCQVAPTKGQTAMSISIQAGEELILKRKTLGMFVLPLEPSDSEEPFQ